MKFIFSSFLTKVGFLLLCALPVTAGDFLLAPGDEIDVSVFARDDLSRVYRIRSDGSISMHSVGAILAEDQFPAELEAEIEKQLSIALEGPVSVTLEVSKWRPVIVAGDVNNPGAVEFGAGIDVRTAVALAGGMLRSASLGDQVTSGRMRVQTEAGHAALYQAQLAALLAERDRLYKERSESELNMALDPPPTVVNLVGKDAAQTLTQAQQDFHLADRSALALAVVTGKKQRDLAKREVDAFAERREIVDTQLTLTLDEIATQEDLLKRGLARATNLLALQQNAAQLRADALEALGLEAAARQKLEKAVAGPEFAQTTRQNDILRRLMQVEADVLRVRTQLREARAFTIAFGGGDLLDNAEPKAQSYEIFRNIEGQSQQLSATLDMELFPGDVLSVIQYAGE